MVLAGQEAGAFVLRRVDLGSGLPETATWVVRSSAGPSEEAILLGVQQLFPSRPVTLGADRSVPTWAWIGGGAGAALLGVGLTFRAFAVSTEGELTDRLGGLTQTQAYELRDRATREARVGLVLLGAGAAALVGFGSVIAFDLLGPSG